MVNLGSADRPEKRVMTAAHPLTTFQCECPRVFTSIYLKLITSYYAHILLMAILYFDRIIRDLKLTKQNICILGLLRPHFCLLHKIFDVTILAKPFVFHSLKHYKILSWPPTCPTMYEVMRSFGAIKMKTHLPFAFDARFCVCTLLVREYTM